MFTSNALLARFLLEDHLQYSICLKLDATVLLPQDFSYEVD